MLIVFSVFSKMLSNLPAEAIIRALDVECQMLKDDLDHDRLTVDEDTFSILCFKQFIQMAKSGEFIRFVKRLPHDHLEFYRETIVRLVQANELPTSAMALFERAFPVS